MSSLSVLLTHIILASALESVIAVSGKDSKAIMMGNSLVMNFHQKKATRRFL